MTKNLATKLAILLAATLLLLVLWSALERETQPTELPQCPGEHHPLPTSDTEVIRA